MATNEVQQDPASPQSIRFELTSDDSDFDLSTGVSAEIHIARRAGTGAEEVLAAIIESSPAPTAVLAVLIHVFGPGEAPDCDEIAAVGIMNLAVGGPFVSEARLINIAKKFKLPD